MEDECTSVLYYTLVAMSLKPAIHTPTCRRHQFVCGQIVGNYPSADRWPTYWSDARCPQKVLPTVGGEYTHNDYIEFPTCWQLKNRYVYTGLKARENWSTDGGPMGICQLFVGSKTVKLKVGMCMAGLRDTVKGGRTMVDGPCFGSEDRGLNSLTGV